MLLKNDFRIETDPNSGSRDVFMYSSFISVNDKTHKQGYLFRRPRLGNYTKSVFLKTKNDFLFLFDAISETDSCLVLDENLQLKSKVKLNTIGLLDAKIVGDKIFTVTNDREIDKTVVSVYTTNFEFLQSFDLSGRTSQVFATESNLIAVKNNSIRIISNELELKEVSLQASSWIQKEEMILGLKPEANSWLLNTNSLELIDLGVAPTQAFWSSNGYFLVSESSIGKYDENNSEEYNFLIPQESGFNKPSIELHHDIFLLSYASSTPLNNDKKFKLLNSQGKQIYSEDAILYSNNPFTPSLSKFNSGDLLLNSPSGLIKLNAQGDVIWDKKFVDRNKASIFINADDSFSMLLDHDLYDVLAQFENDDARCRYQAINSVPETLCSAEESTGYHQAVAKMEGNLPAISWYSTLGSSSLIQSYHGLDIDFIWYKDGIVDSSQFKITSSYGKDTTSYFIDLVPNSTYKVEVKQGNCALMSDEVFFSYADNNEIMQPSITTNPEVIFIGNTVKISGSCENSYFSGGYPGPFPYPNNFKFETPTNDTTYSIKCAKDFARIDAVFWESYGDHHYFGSFGYCLSDTVSANVIVYDPKNVLASENEKLSIRIYPNPAQNYLDIKTPQNLQLNGLDIINSNGVLMQSVSPRTRIKLEGYSSGIYHVRFKFSDHVATRKFVIN